VENTEIRFSGTVRTNGKIVIRDLGCNTAPILEAELFLPFPPKNTLKYIYEFY